MHRRDLLATLAGSSLALTAGCLDDETSEDGPTTCPETVENDGLEGSVCPDDDPESVSESLQCAEGEFDRLETKYDPDDVYWGDAEILALRIAETAYEYGDKIDLTLTNIGSDPEEINDYRSFNFEIYTEDGWQDVRGDTVSEGPRAFPDDGTSHDPNEAWQWEIELTEAGIEDESFFSDSTRVCPELQSGRYRFVFANQFGAEEAVAVAFDVSV